MVVHAGGEAADDGKVLVQIPVLAVNDHTRLFCLAVHGVVAAALEDLAFLHIRAREAHESRVALDTIVAVGDQLEMVLQVETTVVKVNVTRGQPVRLRVDELQEEILPLLVAVGAGALYDRPVVRDSSRREESAVVRGINHWRPRREVSFTPDTAVLFVEELIVLATLVDLDEIGVGEA